MTSAISHALTSRSQHEPSGGRLVAVDGRVLPLVGTALRVDAAGGIARVTLEQRFHNPHAEPLVVRYQVPLPADGAVSGFAFTLAGRRIVGEIDKRARARERYEDAILTGKTAALLEQDRSSVFTQEVGNVPPGAEVVAEIAIDQKLRWLDEGRWEWRFPTVVAPRYIGGAGRVADAERVSVRVADGAIAPRAALELCIGDRLPQGASAESSSHALVTRADSKALTVAFRDEDGATLDRDVVVAWPVASAKVGVALGTARPASDRATAGAAYGLATLVPPQLDRAGEPVPRDLVVLIDTSGSMSGDPLAQAQRVTLALIDTLSERDTLELIEFSWRPQRWKPTPERATATARADARRWIESLSAGGGTEMQAGILEAVAGLRADAQRQVVLISDGLIGFEHEIVRAILDGLPRGSRLHAVGVGSAVNRSLTAAASRAGRGSEVILGIGEDPERAAKRLVARTDAPLVVDLELSGSALVAHRPARLPDLFRGSPALVALELAPEGGELLVRGRTAAGAWSETIIVPPTTAASGNQALCALFGREAVEDLEMEAAAGEDRDGRIEQLGLDFQIATRLTSWVAVSGERTVDPRDPTRREEMPQALPHGMSVTGLGLRAAAGMMPHAYAMPVSPAAPRMVGAALGRAFAGGPPAMRAPYPASPPPPAPPAGYAPAPDESARMIDSEGAEEERPTLEPPPPKQKSLLESVKGFFRGRAAPPVLALIGRLVRRTADGLVCEVTVPQSIDWLPGVLTLVLADGTRIPARIDAAMTTRPGSIAAGATLRLALVHDAALSTAALDYIEIDNTGTTLRIRMSG